MQTTKFKISSTCCAIRARSPTILPKREEITYYSLLMLKSSIAVLHVQQYSARPSFCYFTIQYSDWKVTEMYFRQNIVAVRVLGQRRSKKLETEDIVMRGEVGAIKKVKGRR
jgi:hypothetical protein